MNILHLLSSSTFSGAEKVANSIILNSPSENQTNKMYYCSPYGPVKDYVENYLGIDKLSVRNVSYICRHYDIDVIHAHDVRASIIAGIAKVFNPSLRVISHVHGNDSKMRKLSLKSISYYLITPTLYKIIWVSQDAYEDYFKSNVESVKNKSIVLTNIIDCPPVNKLNITKRSYDVVFFGRVEYPKNPYKFIEILHDYKKTYKKELKAAVVGTGKDEQEIKKKSIQKGLSNITFYGFMEKPLEVIANCKILVITSDYEGLPLALLESLSQGLVAVSTNLGGVSPVIKDGVNGYVIKTNEVSKFSKVIHEILENQERLLHMSKKSVEIFSEYNDSSLYYKTIYKQYLEE